MCRKSPLSQKVPPPPPPPQLSRSYLAQSFGTGASQTDGSAQTSKGGAENKSRCDGKCSEMSKESRGTVSGGKVDVEGLIEINVG